ncbi:ABC transporter substrate-binding protein [Afipia sp. P52-10]|uniref:DUF1007 family protein n=1 Tax=Afipia sp. P52-10 TaxID=1429916 RepID=UPI0003DF3BB0|nr:DUF1007 family protein [Afipia sp. P52-10]ETR78474.1 ABC transporter substrate-binding protein [Afipia sp. P52-10]
MRRLVLLPLIAAFAIWVRPAAAHPHVWVTSQSELVYGADGAITGIRHTWKFDDMFSAYAVQDIQNKDKGVYTREELAPLAQINVDSLKEFDFFTFAKAGKTKEQFLEPVDYFLEYRDSALILHFTLPFKQPVKAKELALEIYDPSYFVGFDLAATDPIKLVGAPASCKAAVQRPDSKSTQAPISEQSFLDGNVNYGAMFSNKIMVDCP